MHNTDGENNSPPTPDITRNWKESEYHNNLTPEQQATLPPSPSSLGELDDELLEEVVGGINTVSATCPLN